MLRVLQDLVRGEHDVYELADRHEVDVKPEGDGDAGRKKWRIRVDRHVRRLAGALDVSHYLALHVAMAHGGPLRGAAGQLAALEDLAEKVEAALGERQRKRLRSISASFVPYEKFPYRDGPRDLAT